MSKIIVPEGCGLALTDGGAIYGRIHYTADPTKRSSEYVTEGKKRFGLKWWMQQMEMQDDIYDGEPVFPDLNVRHHVPELYKTQHMPLIVGSQYFGGWDCGQTRQPAFELCQLTPWHQIQWLFEVIPDRMMSMSEFAPIVRDALGEFCPGIRARIVHIGDPTGNTKAGSDGTSAFQVARQFGFHINPGEQFPTMREDAVNWGLNDWISQEGDESEWVPRVVYSEFGAPVLVAGMKGAYCRQLQANSPTQGPGMRAKPKPQKNWFSHSNDGHQYVSVQLKQLLMSGASKPKPMTNW